MKTYNNIKMTPKNINFGCSSCNKSQDSSLDLDIDGSNFITTTPKQNNKIETIIYKSKSKTTKKKSSSNSSKVTSLF